MALAGATITTTGSKATRLWVSSAEGVAMSPSRGANSRPTPSAAGKGRPLGRNPECNLWSIRLTSSRRNSPLTNNRVQSCNSRHSHRETTPNSHTPVNVCISQPEVASPPTSRQEAVLRQVVRRITSCGAPNSRPVQLPRSLGIGSNRRPGARLSPLWRQTVLRNGRLTSLMGWF